MDGTCPWQHPWHERQRHLAAAFSAGCSEPMQWRLTRHPNIVGARESWLSRARRNAAAQFGQGKRLA